MSRNKRIAKRDQKSFAPTAAALAATAEERRLLSGRTLSDSPDLFIEDTTGQDHIRNKLGVGKKMIRELTIEKILRPSGPAVAAQRQRPAKRASTEIIKKRISTRSSETKDQLYDIWTESATTAKQSRSTRVSVLADNLYSYRPNLSDHVDRLCEIEMAVEAKQSVPVDAQAVSVDNTTSAMTMEERADRELLEPIDEPISDSTITDKDTTTTLNKHRKKTRTERNRDTKERIAREHRHLQATRTRLLKQVDQVSSLTRLYHRQQAAALSVTSLLKPEPKQIVPLSIPLLPEEVPECMRLLPSTHVNPVKEQFKRTCHSGIVRPLRR